MMYAIIATGGKQYKVAEGDLVKVEKIKGEVGADVTFHAVLIADGDTVKTGDEVKTAQVTGTIEAQDKFKKIIVFKYKAKKNERKKQGHRQPYTAVRIGKISV